MGHAEPLHALVGCGALLEGITNRSEGDKDGGEEGQALSCTLLLTVGRSWRTLPTGKGGGGWGGEKGRLREAEEEDKGGRGRGALSHFTL